MKIISIAAIVSLIFAAACSSDKIQSNWNEGDIVVDGKLSDWGENLSFIEEENAAVGVYNNEENLYICFTTNDNLKIMQIMNMGMTLWLIPRSGDVNTRGIIYPERSTDFDIQQMKEKRLIGYEENFVKNLLKNNEQKQTEIQIVNDRNYSLYIYPLDGGDSGINLKLGETMGQFVYEISVPIGVVSENDFSMGFLPGDNIIVGFETGKYSRPKRRRNSGEFSDGGRSGNANPTGVPGVEIYSQPEPVNIKRFVTLAELD